MHLIPEIKTFPKTKLVGKKIIMSFAENKTVQLWQSFMPRFIEVSTPKNANLYSVEIYKNLAFSEQFDMNQKSEKWAAVEIEKCETIPADFEKLTITEGLYAVFS